MKKEKQKAVKTTLYDIILKAFRDAGYTVEEESWVESVGYSVPTREYWFDVQFFPKEMENGAKGYTSHFYFADNKNVLKQHIIYENEYTIHKESKTIAQ